MGLRIVTAAATGGAFLYAAAAGRTADTLFTTLFCLVNVKGGSDDNEQQNADDEKIFHRVTSFLQFGVPSGRP